MDQILIIAGAILVGILVLAVLICSVLEMLDLLKLVFPSRKREDEPGPPQNH
jgi:hypothetical protein